MGSLVAHLVLCGLRLALVCLQAGDYPPDSTGLGRRPSRVVGDTAVLVVVPPLYLPKKKMGSLLYTRMDAIRHLT